MNISEFITAFEEIKREIRSGIGPGGGCTVRMQLRSGQVVSFNDTRWSLMQAQVSAGNDTSSMRSFVASLVEAGVLDAREYLEESGIQTPHTTKPYCEMCEVKDMLSGVEKKAHPIGHGDDSLDAYRYGMSGDALLRSDSAPLFDAAALDRIDRAATAQWTRAQMDRAYSRTTRHPVRWTLPSAAERAGENESPF